MLGANKPDTIAAQATPTGRGGIAVVRVSGPRVREIAEAILGQVPTPRTACFSSFLDQDGKVLDQGLALFFPGPHSFTAEDVLELQGHGGPVVVHLLLGRILSLGARLARPGEFSERAFLNGKIDLAQAEAIADLIHASTEQAARSALRSLQGEFSKKIQALVEKLIELRTYIEAAIDFSEEEIDFLSHDALHQRFDHLQQELTAVQNAARQGSLLREGLNVVIAGKPNVGKSTLLNLLCGQERAIVTPIPGTTRDILREPIQMDGIPLHLIDTAGLRETNDLVEQEGIQRAQQEIENADLILYMINASDEEMRSPLDDLLKNNSENSNPLPPVLLIRNKIDLTGETPSIQEKGGVKVISLSAKEKLGLSLLKETIQIEAGCSLQPEGTFSARQRHLDALEKAGHFLNASYQQLKTTCAAELIAEELRLAQNQLCEITGQFTTEDLLGRIFSSFCVGK